jgi:hypothetical protein
MASTSTSTMESLFKFRGVKIFYENAVFSFGNSWPYEDNLLCEKSNIKEKREKNAIIVSTMICLECPRAVHALTSL